LEQANAKKGRKAIKKKSGTKGWSEGEHRLVNFIPNAREKEQKPKGVTAADKGGANLLAYEGAVLVSGEGEIEEEAGERKRKGVIV